jgi:NAD(P)-dependent dehydrogenase (short-subunit alcohol dehydrogenase family)
MRIRTAIVTGANRGIGQETARQLAAAGLRVIATARDPQAGAAAARAAGAEYARLDVSDEASRLAFRDWTRENAPQVDVLVNNAGIYPERDGNGLEADLDVIRSTLEVNTFGPLRLVQLLAPLLVTGAQVIHVSSGMGQLSDMGGASPAYRISKTALNAVTRILAAELAARGIAVNSVCPGWVRTDMGGASATRPVEKGAETIVWLALQGANGPSGGFFRDKQPIPW